MDTNQEVKREDVDEWKLKEKKKVEALNEEQDSEQETLVEGE